MRTSLFVSRGRHKMGTVGRLTGFSPALLRAWESRHRLLSPHRGTGGQRLYSDDDVQVLRAVRALLDEGRSIGEIALLGRKTLLARTPSLVQAVVKQVRLELTLDWTLDGGNAAAAVRSMHAASLAATRLAARLDLKQLVELVVETLDADFDAALARIWILEPGENALYLRASAGLSRRTSPARGRESISQTIPIRWASWRARARRSSATALTAIPISSSPGSSASSWPRWRSCRWSPRVRCTACSRPSSGSP